MLRENLESEWENISEKLRNRFPKLTEADLIYKKGHEEDVLKKIGLKLNKQRNEVVTLIGTL